MKFTGPALKSEFEACFGPIEGLTVRQLWCLVKMMKHCRLRCRSNAALYNYLNGNFTSHSFREVTKVHPDGTTYPGLEITSKVKPTADVYVPQSEEE